MKEVTPTYAEAYLRDRLIELKNQLPLGDPFIFIGINTMARVIERLSGNTINPFNRIMKGVPFTIANGSCVDLRMALEFLSDFFSLRGTAINLSHENERHLAVAENGRVTVAAEPCIEALKDMIDELFSPGKELTYEDVLCMSTELNAWKFVGLQDPDE